MEINKSIEQEYLSENSSYKIEKKLLSNICKADFQLLIKSFENSYIKERNKLIKVYKKRLSEFDFKWLNEISKDFVKMIFYYFHWGEELNINKDVIKKLKFHYKISFSEVLDRGKYIQFDLNSINIKTFLSLYMKISLKKQYLCPLHEDKTPSFYIYEKSNSRYCYWCQKGWNIANFIMDIEWINYKESLKKLSWIFA